MASICGDDIAQKGGVVTEIREFQFDVMIRLPQGSPDIEDVLDRLFEAGCAEDEPAVVIRAVVFRDLCTAPEGHFNRGGPDASIPADTKRPG